MTIPLLLLLHYSMYRVIVVHGNDVLVAVVLVYAWTIMVMDA